VIVDGIWEEVPTQVVVSGCDLSAWVTSARLSRRMPVVARIGGACSGGAPMVPRRVLGSRVGCEVDVDVVGRRHRLVVDEYGHGPADDGVIAWHAVLVTPGFPS